MSDSEPSKPVACSCDHWVDPFWVMFWSFERHCTPLPLKSALISSGPALSGVISVVNPDVDASPLNIASSENVSCGSFDGKLTVRSTVGIESFWATSTVTVHSTAPSSSDRACATSP